MARKSIERHLPSLGKLFPHFHGLAATGFRHRLVTDLLRKAAVRLRREESHPFYSMREVALFLKLPIRTIELAYQKLESEGLISRIRSSRTLLLGSVFQTHHPARGVVSIPLAFPSLRSHFGQRFYYRLGEELRRHYFVTNLVLNTDLESNSPGFAGRLWSQSDILIWLFPDISTKDMMLRLRDHGVRNILLNHEEDNFLPSAYLMEWEPAYRKVIAAWRRDGIRHVVVARGISRTHRRVVLNFLQLLQEAGCTAAVSEPTPAALCREVEKGARKKVRTACAILDYALTDTLCTREPVATAELMGRCRVLFGRGLVHAPYFIGRPHRADVIGFSGDVLATRVAQDLQSCTPDSGEAVRIVPQWRPQVNPSETFL